MQVSTPPVTTTSTPAGISSSTSSSEPAKTISLVQPAAPNIQLIGAQSWPAMLPITYISTTLPSGTVLTPQILSTATRLPILASPVMGLNPQLATGGIQQVIALNQLPSSPRSSAIPMISVQVPKTHVQSPTKTDDSSWSSLTHSMPTTDYTTQEREPSWLTGQTWLSKIDFYL